MSDPKIRFTSIAADPASQPPRLFTTFRGGGAVVIDPANAEALKSAGFMVFRERATAAESRYLTASTDSLVAEGDDIFFIRCDGKIVQTSGGSMFCSTPEGLRLMKTVSVSRTGSTPDWLVPAEVYAPRRSIRSAQFFAASSEPSSSQESQASHTVELYQRIAKFYTLSAAFAETFPAESVPLSIRNLLATCQVFLARYAQPVAVFSGMPAGTMPEEVREKLEDASLGFAVSTGVLVTVALIAVSFAASVIALSRSVNIASAVYKETRDGELAILSKASTVLADPKATRDQKEAARRIIEAFGGRRKGLLDEIVDAGEDLLGGFGNLIWGAVALIGAILVGSSVFGADD